MGYKLKYLFDDYDNFTSDMEWEDYYKADAHRQQAYEKFRPDVNVIILIQGTEEDEDEFVNMLELEE